MQLPADFGASPKKLNEEDIKTLAEIKQLAAPSPEVRPVETSKPMSPPSVNIKVDPIPENEERARLVQLIEDAKRNSDDEIAAAKEEQQKKDNIALMLSGVNQIGGGLVSKSAGSKVSPDNSYSEMLNQQGKAAVEDAKISRDTRLKDLLGNYDRLRQDLSDKRELSNDKFDRIYKQKQLEISAANAAASRQLASEAKAANRDFRERALKLREDNEKEKDDVLTIPGYDRVSGRITSEEAKQTRGAIASVGELKDLLAQYKAAIGKEGTFELFGSGSEKLKKLTKGIQRAMGRANEFGVIQAGELPMLEQMSTYDPESMRALFTKNSTAAAGIDQIIDNLDYKMSNKVKSIGYVPKVENQPIDPKVQMFMSKNPQVKSEAEAIKILKDHGKL